MTKRFSIITPSYNQGIFIERTIQSVFSQNFTDLEYVVMDGGSKDTTIDVLKKYSDKITWVSEPDKGQSHAVNKGLAQTSGEIIGWLNSDDVYYPGCLQIVSDFFEAYPEVDVLYGDAHHIDEDDAFINKYGTEPWNASRLYDVCYLCQPATFFRRSVIEKFGGLNENLQFCMDYEFWLRLSKHGVKFYYLNQLLAGSRLHENTKTIGSRLKVHKKSMICSKNFTKKSPNAGLSIMLILLH